MSRVKITPLTLFSPTQITGCKAWFDAFDASYTTSGTTVTAWTNKSGNANASTGGGTVSINQATLNGKSSVRFAAGTNFLNVGPISYSTSYRNQFFVVTLGASGNYYWYLNCNDTICGQCYSWNDSSIEINRSGTVGLLTYPTGYFGSTSFVSICTSSGGNTGIWINGVSQRLLYNNVGTGGFWSGGGSSSITLGGESGRSTGTLDMYELLQYDGNLTTAQRQQIEGYLAQKWGLTGSLPPFHPGLRSKLYPTLTVNRLLNSTTYFPTNITGCQLWLDAADSSTITGTTSVTAWNDKSGNGFNGTVVNASVGSPIAPSYVTNSINGLSAITMSGTSYFTGSTNVNSTTLTCFFIGNCVFGTGGSSQQRILGLGVTGLDDYSSTLRPLPLTVISGGTQLLSYRNANMASATVISGTNFIGCCLFDGTSNYMYKDGTLGTQVASSGTFTTSIYGVGSDAGTQFMLGTSSLGTNCLVGKIGEIIVYNTALTTSQRQEIEGYLAQKWGLTGSLPLNHPGLRSKLYPSLTRNRLFNPVSFSPINVTSAMLWLDGADPLGTGVTPANGATISTWVDKSGSGNNATPSSGRIAATFSSALNCVYFQSSNVGYQTSYPANPNNETMFIVANIDSPSSINNNTLIGGQYGARSLGIGWNGTGATNACAYLNNEIAWQTSTPAGSYTAGTKALITGQVSGGSSLSIAMNGATFSTGGGGGYYAGTTTHLGVDTTTTAYYYKGYAMEIIFYNTLLNATQRRQIETYLASKWGLTLV